MLNTIAIEKLVQAYIDKNFKEPVSVPILMPAVGPPIRIVIKDPDEIDFIYVLSKRAAKKILPFIIAPTSTADIFPKSQVTPITSRASKRFLPSPSLLNSTLKKPTIYLLLPVLLSAKPILLMSLFPSSLSTKSLTWTWLIKSSTNMNNLCSAVNLSHNGRPITLTFKL